MKKLTFCEQVGIVIPGSVLLFGLLFFFPSLKELLAKDGVSVGQLGIFVLLSYAAGHLIAALGNIAENLLWRPLGGFPSDWVVHEKTSLLSDEQRERLPKKIQAQLGIAIKVMGMDRKKWFPISRQIYADVERNGKRERIETFNGNYGLKSRAGRRVFCARMRRRCIGQLAGSAWRARFLWRLLVPGLSVWSPLWRRTVRAIPLDERHSRQAAEG